MQPLKQQISHIIETAITQTTGLNSPALLQAAAKPEYGDYQANFAMKLAKQLQKKPQEIAQQVIEKLKENDLFAKLEVSGPGFINIKIANKFLAQQLNQIAQDDRLGIQPATNKQTVVIDYSSPNIAKEMHVGHLRSTIIGDAIARILLFLGHHVIPQNHLGDWGTQFGMLIAYILKHEKQDQTLMLADLNQLYKKAKALFDADADFANTSRDYVVKLQAGDAATLAIWQKIIAESQAHFQSLYNRLNVLLETKYNCGESFYNPMLAAVVEELVQKHIAETSEGAIVVFLQGFVDKDNQPVPLLLRKSDGGFLYATTDVAALKYRLATLKATRLIYVTDARQQQHFAMLFQLAEKTGWKSADIELMHVPFGTVLGKDKKPFKTRSGEVIKLVDLLDEAKNRALKIIQAKNPQSTVEETNTIADAISIGAIKYADLATDRVRDYVFDWDQMLAFEGNTAPYLQNAYVRIASIFNKASLDLDAQITGEINITDLYEHQLAIKLLELSDSIVKVAKIAKPHLLCHYLFELSTRFHQFYEHCPILSADGPTKTSRLQLAQITAQTLQLGLSLLGIHVIKKM
ncbi:MAG: arginine--tRNA ligase [Pseudomonadota bacterium]